MTIIVALYKEIENINIGLNKSKDYIFSLRCLSFPSVLS